MEIIIEVVFMAIHFDNYQGGSGKNYTDRIIFKVDEESTVVEIQDKISDYIEGVHNSFTGEVKVIDVKMINLAG